MDCFELYPRSLFLCGFTGCSQQNFLGYQA